MMSKPYKKIVVIEDAKLDIDAIFYDLFDKEIVDYSSFRPYTLHKSITLNKGNGLIEDPLVDKLNQVENDYELLNELYKLISRDKEQDFFNLLFDILEIEDANFIIIDVALKGTDDDEGLRFYDYLTSKKGIEKEKIIIASVSHKSVIEDQFSKLEVNTELAENIVPKDKSQSYTLEICKIINNGK